MYNKHILNKRVEDENVSITQNLIKEKIIIRGVYQNRAKLEIELREWVGSSASIFFIAGEAGIGKTNLLSWASRLYSLWDLNALMIRSGRLEPSSITEHLAVVLEFNPTIDLMEYFQSIVSQSNPLILLIDDLDAAAAPEEWWAEILNLCDKFLPGSLKFVITITADDSLELDRFSISEDESYFLYNNFKLEDLRQQRVEGSIKPFVHWMTPLNREECESAWDQYARKYNKKYAPTFSFSDLKELDSALYFQLANPFSLRLFLESYHASPLPEKDILAIPIYKQWFSRFSADEQKFLYLLAEEAFEHNAAKLPLESVMQNQELATFLLSNDKKGAFLSLQSQGLVNQFSIANTDYLSIQSNALLGYLLGQIVAQKSYSLAEIQGFIPVENNLRRTGVKEMLKEEALKGRIERLCTLLCEDIKAAGVCLDGLIIYMQVYGPEALLAQMLKMCSNKMWSICLALEEKLRTLGFHSLLGDFFKVLIEKIDLSCREAMVLGIRAALFLRRNQIPYSFRDKLKEGIHAYNEDLELQILMGNFLDAVSEFESAFNYFSKALSIQLRDGEGTILQYIYIHIKLSIVNIDKNRRYSERDYINEALNGLGSQFEGNYLEIATLYKAKGRSEEVFGNLPAAVDYFKKALDIYRSNLGEYNLTTAKTYEWLGYIYYRMDNIPECIECFEKAIRIQKKIVGEMHPNVEQLYFDSGMAVERFDTYLAISYFEKSLKVRIHWYGHAHHDVIEVLNHIAKAYLRKNNYDSAIETYEKVIQFQEKFLDENHPKIAKSYERIAKVHIAADDLPAAFQTYEKALSIRLKANQHGFDKHADSSNDEYWKNKLDDNNADTIKLLNNLIQLQLATLGHKISDLEVVYQFLKTIVDRKLGMGEV